LETRIEIKEILNDTDLYTMVGWIIFLEVVSFSHVDAFVSPSCVVSLVLVELVIYSRSFLMEKESVGRGHAHQYQSLV